MSSNINYDSLQVYIHNPFCEKHCKFCVYCDSIYNESDYDLYYKKLLPLFIEESLPIIKKFKNTTYWFGGGTPNLMRIEDMKNIFSRFKFNQNDYKIIEVQPSFLTKEQIDVFGQYNFDVVSLGIQTLNNSVLEGNNRKSISIENVEFFINYIKQKNIKVSIDLLILENMSTSDFIHDINFFSNLNVDTMMLSYDYKFKRIKEVDEIFGNIAYDFLRDGKYKCDIKNIYEFISNHAAIKIYKDEDALKGYVSDIGLANSLNNINVLSVGAWKNKKVFSKIGDIRYSSYLDKNNNLIIENIL